MPDDRRSLSAADEDDDDLVGYGRDYRPGEVRAADLGILDAEAYVAARDPLRARVIARSGAEAAVELGVDPGTFYCGDQFAALIALGRAPPFAGVTRVGFVHVPPDRRSAPELDGAGLLDRASNLDLAAQVLAVLLRGLSAGTGPVHLVLTGFGPFVGVVDNPSAAIVGDPAVIERAMAMAAPGVVAVGESSRLNDVPAGIRGVRRGFVGPEARSWTVTSLVLPLAASDDAARRGDYFSADMMTARFGVALSAALAPAGDAPPAAIVSLGVASSQLRGGRGPAFRIETQTRGWHRGESRSRHASDAFQRDLALARIFMAARRRGDPRLRDLP